MDLLQASEAAGFVPEQITKLVRKGCTSSQALGEIIKEMGLERQVETFLSSHFLDEKQRTTIQENLEKVNRYVYTVNICNCDDGVFTNITTLVKYIAKKFDLHVRVSGRMISDPVYLEHITSDQIQEFILLCKESSDWVSFCRDPFTFTHITVTAKEPNVFDFFDWFM